MILSRVGAASSSTVSTPASTSTSSFASGCGATRWYSVAATRGLENVPWVNASSAEIVQLFCLWGQSRLTTSWKWRAPDAMVSTRDISHQKPLHPGQLDGSRNLTARSKSTASVSNSVLSAVARTFPWPGTATGTLTRPEVQGLWPMNAGFSPMSAAAPGTTCSSHH